MSFLLNKEYDVAKMHLANRLVFESIGTETADENGKVTDKMLDWYREKSKGYGLAILEHAHVSKWGKASDHMLSVCEDEDIPGLKRITDLFHQNGCKVQLQLDHGGGWSVPALRGCLDPKNNPEGKFVATDLTKDQIKGIIDDFAAAAYRAKQAGFDGVQIKACHVYLLSNFYSPLTNKRNDEYGADCLENRLRIILETVRAVREKVGEDYSVSIRFSCEDFTEGGSTVEDFVQSIKVLEQTGIDLLDISGGPKYRFINPNSNEPGYFKSYGKIAKEAINIPVIVTGGITTAEQAEELLEGGYTDLVGVCRASVKNENWAQEALFYCSAMDF